MKAKVKVVFADMEVNVLAQSQALSPAPQPMLDDPIQAMYQLFLDAKTSHNPIGTRKLMQDDGIKCKESFKDVKENLYLLGNQQRIMYERTMNSDWQVWKLTKEQGETSIELSRLHLQEACLIVQRKMRNTNKDLELRMGMNETKIYILEAKIQESQILKN